MYRPRRNAPGDLAKHQSSKRYFVSSAVLFALIFMQASGLSPLSAASAGEDELWILIDTGALTLDLMSGNTVVQRFENIAIGSNGSTHDKTVGDEKTPLGDFRIDAIRTSQRFHLFLALNYPTSVQAERALSKGRVSKQEYRALKEARERGDPPPQNTRLGGNLGIHGIGSGSLEIHRLVNWTDGCVALTNEQIEQLGNKVAVGTRVRIR